MELNKSCSEQDDIYIFKVKDYDTKLVGRRNEQEGFFYIQRGDGNIYRYDDYRVTYSEKIFCAKEKPEFVLDDPIRSKEGNTVESIIVVTLGAILLFMLLLWYMST